MGLRVSYSREDGIAVMYCSTTGWAFGPIFESDGLGHDGEDRAQAFLRWIDMFVPMADEIRNGRNRQRWNEYHDPRMLTEAGLSHAFGLWQAQEQDQYAREDEALSAELRGEA